jgi:DNA-binding NarL/FixJ family response regulator
LINLRRGSHTRQAVAEIREKFESVLMLVSSIHDETLYVRRALDAGAAGYIDKQEASLGMINAIHCVLAGDTYLSERMARRVRPDVPTP